VARQNDTRHEPGCWKADRKEEAYRGTGKPPTGESDLKTDIIYTFIIIALVPIWVLLCVRINMSHEVIRGSDKVYINKDDL
jgi:hypothetical protein